MNTEGVSPPQKVQEKILSRVFQDLHPSAWKVFAKLSLVHFGVGTLTLSLCPQFGVRFFGEGLGLMKLFSLLGSHGCMAACGAFFVGMTLLLASLFLKTEEVKKLRASSPLQISALVLISLGAFIMADAQILLVFALSWSVGSLIGGYVMLEIGWWLKSHP